MQNGCVNLFNDYTLIWLKHEIKVAAIKVAGIDWKPGDPIPIILQLFL